MTTIRLRKRWNKLCHLFEGFSCVGSSRDTNCPGLKSKGCFESSAIQYRRVNSVAFSMRITFPVCQGWIVVLIVNC